MKILMFDLKSKSIKHINIRLAISNSFQTSTFFKHLHYYLNKCEKCNQIRMLDNSVWLKRGFLLRQDVQDRYTKIGLGDPTIFNSIFKFLSLNN